MDEMTFEELMRSYANDVFRVSYLYLKDWQLAEEAVQDTFVKVYEKHNQFRGESSEKTWIMHIAINVCNNYKRNQWFKKVLLGENHVLPRYSEEPIEAELLRRDESAHLLETIMNLKANEKAVILLYYYQNMKISEIAVALGIKEATVKTRLQRARKKIKEFVEEETYGGTRKAEIYTESSAL